MTMSLSSHQLDAFLAVCELRSFTAAAARLHVTQSALSQRIKNLEEDLGSTLLLREAAGLRLTSLGERLLRYGKTKESLEREFLDQVKNPGSAMLKGVVRVAGFSTVTKSILLPVLAPLVEANPDLQLDLTIAELHELPEVLASGQADFVLVNAAVRREGVENHLLGHERNVLIGPSRGAVRDDVYLDHDERDTTTLDYFEQQGRSLPKKFRRSFLDDIETIIAGVESGLGRAVAPIHLVRDRKNVEAISGFKIQKVPVHLSHFTQPFYTELQKALLETLKSGVARALAAGGASAVRR